MDRQKVPPHQMCDRLIADRAPCRLRDARSSSAEIVPNTTMTLLTVKDMATRLQVKEKTIYAWASQGKIPCVKVNGVIRFDAEGN